MGFAATLASLILAAFAIFYAVYANSTTEKILRSVVEASNQVKDSAQSVSRSSNGLGEEVKELSHIASSLRDNVESHKIKLDQFSQDAQALIKQSPSPQSNDKNPDKGDIESFLALASPLGVLAMLMASYSAENGIKVDGESIISEIDLDWQWMYGFLSAFSTTTLAKGDPSDGIVFESAPPYARVRAEYVRKIGVYSNGDKSMRRTMSKWLESIEDGLELQLAQSKKEPEDEGAGTKEQ